MSAVKEFGLSTVTRYHLQMIKTVIRSNDTKTLLLHGNRHRNLRHEISKCRTTKRLSTKYENVQNGQTVLSNE